jgi:hypothetical protein
MLLQVQKRYAATAGNVRSATRRERQPQPPEASILPNVVSTNRFSLGSTAL